MNRGYIFIFLATVFFSSMEVALKTVAHDFNPMQLNCTRFLVGGLLLIPFALRGLRQHGARVTAAAWKGFAWLGFVGLVVSMMFYQMSILYAPASVVSVLFSCNPVLVLAFAYLILRADIRPQHITALVMEVAAASSSSIRCTPRSIPWASRWCCSRPPPSPFMPCWAKSSAPSTPAWPSPASAAWPPAPR